MGGLTERGFRDRDFIQTPERFLFCVVGVIHPPDRVISYVKYIPSENGLWGRGGEKYSRVMRYYTIPNLMETLRLLERYPEYLYQSHVMGIKISAAPKEKIIRHFKPEEKMMELAKVESNRLDMLEEKALNLALKISEESSVPLSYFGVTGSILLGIHQPFSDIDLVVYGVKNSMCVKETLSRIYSSSEELGISKLKGAVAEEWCLNKSKLYPLTYEDAKKILDRKWNRGVFQGVEFSIHPVKLENEVSEKYGDRIFKPEGTIKIEAVIADSSDSDFMPSTYLVEDVRVIDGPRVSDIREVASYEGLYSGIANEGERILVYGKLEHVTDNRSSEVYHRVLVGSLEAHGRDYIKPLL